MHGLVNQALKDLIVEKFTAEKWTEIRTKAGVSEDDFVAMKSYPDHITYCLVGAASEVLGAPGEVLLKAFGQYWIEFTKKEGYGPLMDLFGVDLRSCLKNLNSMHSRMGMMMPEFQPPKFNVSEPDASTLLLEYHSQRPGLAPMVEGLLEGLALKFGNKITIETQMRANQADPDLFTVKILE